MSGRFANPYEEAWIEFFHYILKQCLQDHIYIYLKWNRDILPESKDLLTTGYWTHYVTDTFLIIQQKNRRGIFTIVYMYSSYIYKHKEGPYTKIHLYIFFWNLWEQIKAPCVFVLYIKSPQESCAFHFSIYKTPFKSFSRCHRRSTNSIFNS